MTKILAIIVGIINLVWIVLFLVTLVTTTDSAIILVGVVLITQLIVNTTYIVLYIIKLYKESELSD